MKGSLGHCDQDRALAWAHEQAAKLHNGKRDLLAGKLTVGALLNLYLERKTPKKRSATEQKQDGRRAELWGQQTECIYIDVDQARASTMGVTVEDAKATLTQQNVIVDSGGVDVLDQRLRLETTGEFDIIDD